jgi:hypothetical protein
MVWLSGPRQGVGRVKLHDPPLAIIRRAEFHLR